MQPPAQASRRSPHFTLQPTRAGASFGWSVSHASTHAAASRSHLSAHVDDAGTSDEPSNNPRATSARIPHNIARPAGRVLGSRAMKRRTAALALLALPATLARVARAAPSSSTSTVTVFGATWCGPCHHLHDALRSRGVPFDAIDVDRYPDLYARAKQASGTNGIPLTGVSRDGATTWIVGADADAVERAYRG